MKSSKKSIRSYQFLLEVLSDGDDLEFVLRQVVSPQVAPVPVCVASDFGELDASIMETVFPDSTSSETAHPKS